MTGRKGTLALEAINQLLAEQPDHGCDLCSLGVRTPGKMAVSRQMQLTVVA